VSKIWQIGYSYVKFYAESISDVCQAIFAVLSGKNEKNPKWPPDKRQP